MNMLGEEPPYLLVGTDVSAKYKGAFCEAKIRKVDRLVKCKIAFKLGFGSHTVLDSHVKGILRVGATVEARHPEKKELVEGSITKIQDCSQYTVVFDDGDITTLRRSALCLKSGRHFAESETLDQLPLTHPEHFGNPVVGGRRGGRRRLGDESSDGEEPPRRIKPKEEKETEIGKVVCVELGDKKKVKDNWFPGLVVAPNAQDAVRIRVKEEYLVRSFKDGRYYTVPKKEATDFTRELSLKVDHNTLKGAVDKALTYLEKDELPPHWDRELLLGLLDSDESDSDGGLDSDSSDDEPTEEKDHFVAQLYKFMDDRGTPINNCPSVCSRDLDLYKLFKIVHKLNGYNRVSNQNQWKLVSTKIGMGISPGIVTQVKYAYKRYLHSFEDFNRKLGCTMVNHPRISRSRNRSGRSLIRDKDRSTPVGVKVEVNVSPKVEKEEVPEVISVPPTKKIVKEEEIKIATKVDPEKDKDGKDNKEETLCEVNDDVDVLPTILRKKFPSLKASPRTKDEPASSLGKRMPNMRLKRLTRENSTDEDSKGQEEQRSTTRSQSKEEISKRAMRSEPTEIRRGKSSSKGSDSDGSKRAKPSTSDPEKDSKQCEDVEKRGKARSGSDDGGVKRARKRLNTDTGSEDTKDPKSLRPCLPRNKSVFVGDVLKVYYGSPSDPNGIYEAKVIDIEGSDNQEMYLVHYSGWNSRYDEWINRSKIAENLSWTARRVKPPPEKVDKVLKVVVQKKKPSVNKEPGRSTTPSSITSSSSRTKSPATPISVGKRRSARRAEASAPTPRRTRRLSGHTDASIDSPFDSESESVASETDSETKRGKLITEDVSTETCKKKEIKKIESKLPLKRKPIKKILDITSQSESAEKKRPRLAKAMSVKEESEKDDSSELPPVKEVTSEEDVKLEDPPKGRDFDLNEIRSEMKGISKPVKVNSTLELEDCETSLKSNTIVEENSKIADENIELESKIVERAVELPISAMESSDILNTDKIGGSIEKVIADSLNLTSCDAKSELETVPVEPIDCQPESKPFEIKEDIYEFKEPEPFEFQDVRRPIRLFDDIIERSPDKGVKRVNVGSPPMRSTFEKRELTPLEVEVKNRFKKTIGKNMKELEEDNKEEIKIIECTSSEIVVNEESLLSFEEPPSSPSPPPLIESSVLEEQVALLPLHKLSPEPPCLIPVTETRVCRPPELSPILTREQPPRLDSDISSLDSESDERLIIANDDESTSNDVKPETLPSLITEVKRSPLSEIRLKRIEERVKSPAAYPLNEPCSAKVLLQEKVLDIFERTDESEEKEKDSEEGEMGLRSLLCDEDIPGSPAPKEASEDVSFATPTTSNAAVVMDNTPPTTPPTTPESNLSSPREDRNGSSLDNESLKSLRGSSDREVDQDGNGGKGGKYGKRCDKGPPGSPKKKRRRCRKRSESIIDGKRSGVGRGRRPRDLGSDSDDGNKRTNRRVKRDPNASDSDDGVKRVRRMKPRHSDHSESDDSSDTSIGNNVPDPLYNDSSSRLSYNFVKDIPSDLDPNQRIAFIQNLMQELRKTYTTFKSELAALDRRRKKLRRNKKDKEEKAAAAAAAVAVPSVVKLPQETQEF